MVDENIISSLVINGDLSKLSPQQKVDYYRQFCERLGLDPLSQPFKLLRLNGKEVLYCDRSGAQQLNKIHKVSHEIKARETVSGCYVVTAQASTPDGRKTESIGAVPIENLRGDALCNAMMKGETKAKRRATLDLLGLGILDETETEAIPNAKTIEPNEWTATRGPALTIPANPFKTTYKTVKAVQGALDKAEEVDDVVSLYYANQSLIDGDAKLKEAVKEKRDEYKERDAYFTSEAEIQAEIAAEAHEQV